MSTPGMPWRDPSRLTEADKWRLGQLTEHQARQLDVTSDEHQYVWGFRQDRPKEEHRMRLRRPQRPGRTGTRSSRRPGTR
jgi:hypothetical protein